MPRRALHLPQHRSLRLALLQASALKATTARRAVTSHSASAANAWWQNEHCAGPIGAGARSATMVLPMHSLDLARRRASPALGDEEGAADRRNVAEPIARRASI
jgi:hypothetical protein